MVAPIHVANSAAAPAPFHTVVLWNIIIHLHQKCHPFFAIAAFGIMVVLDEMRSASKPEIIFGVCPILVAVAFSLVGQLNAAFFKRAFARDMLALVFFVCLIFFLIPPNAFPLDHRWIAVFIVPKKGIRSFVNDLIEVGHQSQAFQTLYAEAFRNRIEREDMMELNGFS